MTVRATRVELFRFCSSSPTDIDTNRRDAWKQLAIMTQQMQNRMWQIWLCHHASQGSAEQLKRHFELFRAWQQADKTTRGEKPKWPVVCCDKTLSNKIYHTISAEFPLVSARTRVLLQNKWQSGLGSRKAASGSLPGWVAILFALESLPSCTRPQPIPFDRDNCRLFSDGDQLKLELRIERIASADTKSKPSVVEHVSLMLNRRKANSQRQVVERIIRGEYEFAGSSLVFDKRSGKWFASIAYKMPERANRPKLDAGKVMTLVPGKRWPWVVQLRYGATRHIRPFGGNGLHVENVRRRILRERQERKSHYRWSGTNQKGHGRRRAAEVWAKLSNRWRNFGKRYNHQVTTQLVRMCVDHGIGTLVYLQPPDEYRHRYFLTKAGNYANSGMSWEYFQVKAMLAYKCQEAGIQLVESVREQRPKAKPKRSAKKESLAK